MRRAVLDTMESCRDNPIQSLLLNSLSLTENSVVPSEEYTSDA